MAFDDQSDPSVPSQEFDQYPSGEKEVNGIHSYITKDESGVPYYKERDGRPYVMLKLRIPDGTEGPPMSANPGELALIVAAFAGHEAIKYLPGDRSSTAYLLKVVELANGQAPEQANKMPMRRMAYVGKKGFVRNLPGMDLPTDMFFRFIADDIRNLDGKTDPLYFQLHENFHQEVINFRVRVVGDMNNNRTPYDGATVSTLIENPFAGTSVGTDGTGMTLQMPKFKVNTNKSTPKSVLRMKNLVNVFAPEINEYEWITDATRSAYGTNEAENPIVVIADHILRGNKVAVGKVTLSTKSTRNAVRLDLLDFVPADTGVVPGQLPAPAAKDRANLRALYKAIADYQPGAFVEGTGDFPVFSESGKQWAREKMVPIWDELGLPAEHQMKALTETQAQLLLGNLLEKVGWPKTTPEAKGLGDF
jgi:hypothetical protein